VNGPSDPKEMLAACRRLSERLAGLAIGAYEAGDSLKVHADVCEIGLREGAAHLKKTLTEILSAREAVRVKLRVFASLLEEYGDPSSATFQDLRTVLRGDG